MINGLINSSLTTSSVEYFTLNGIIHQTSNGLTEELEMLPQNFYNLLLNDLKSDEKANKGLDKLNIKEEAQRVNKHYECNYSLFDGSSDVSACGTVLGPKEYVPCSKRLSCAAHGLICKIPAGLTVRQAAIAKMIAMEQSDAQICAEMFISQETLRTHKNGIEKKIGAKGKVAIAVWAIKNRIV